MDTDKLREALGKAEVVNVNLPNFTSQTWGQLAVINAGGSEEYLKLILEAARSCLPNPPEDLKG